MEIVVLDADDRRCRELCTMLEELSNRAVPLSSYQNLEDYIQSSTCQVVMLDLDSLPAEKNLFRRLKKMKPSLCIMGLSNRPFHPELEEAMSSHIYACLSKPVDEEELSFWIRSLS